MRPAAFLTVVLAFASSARAQDDWFGRVLATKAEQPGLLQPHQLVGAYTRQSRNSVPTAPRCLPAGKNEQGPTATPAFTASPAL